MLVFFMCMINYQQISTSVTTVTVRVRPLNEEEMSVTSANSRSRSGFRKLKSASNVNANQTHAWTSQGDTITQTETRKLVQGKSQFSFDSVFDESANTTHVYDNAVQSVVRGITEGKHGTVFMYGQTSSGKTYTMQGADGANMEKENGVLQLAARDLLRWAEQAEKEVTIRVSYFEIYNETVRDLLGDLADEEETSPRSPSRKQPPLPVLTVREDSVRGGVFLNCEEIDVNDMTTMLGILQHGNSNRSVASTGMNAQSSRSHAIFRISLEIQEEGVKKMATLNLVDLAGSENSFTADTTSQRKREGGKINQRCVNRISQRKR